MLASGQWQVYYSYNSTVVPLHAEDAGMQQMRQQSPCPAAIFIKQGGLGLGPERSRISGQILLQPKLQDPAAPSDPTSFVDANSVLFGFPVNFFSKKNEYMHEVLNEIYLQYFLWMGVIFTA